MATVVADNIAKALTAVVCQEFKTFDANPLEVQSV